MDSQSCSCESNQQQPEFLFKQMKHVQKDADIMKRIKEANVIFAS
jgi:hypothetical protein